MSFGTQRVDAPAGLTIPTATATGTVVGVCVTFETFIGDTVCCRLHGRLVTPDGRQAPFETLGFVKACEVCGVCGDVGDDTVAWFARRLGDYVVIGGDTATQAVAAVAGHPACRALLRTALGAVARSLRADAVEALVGR